MPLAVLDRLDQLAELGLLPGDVDGGDRRDRYREEERPRIAQGQVEQRIIESVDRPGVPRTKRLSARKSMIQSTRIDNATLRRNSMTRAKPRTNTTFPRAVDQDGRGRKGTVNPNVARARMPARAARPSIIVDRPRRKHAAKRANDVGEIAEASRANGRPTSTHGTAKLNRKSVSKRDTRGSNAFGRGHGEVSHRPDACTRPECRGQPTGATAPVRLVRVPGRPGKVHAHPPNPVTWPQSHGKSDHSSGYSRVG